MGAEARRAVGGRGGPDRVGIEGAREAPLPPWIAPQLATLETAPPAGAGWIHEIKLDGYRMLCRLSDGRARLLTRGGQDWTARLRAVAEAAEALGIQRGYLDGELVVLREDGTTSFGALQAALSAGRDRELVYFVFDLLHLEGRDLRGVPQVERKALLAASLEAAGPAAGALRYADHVRGRGEAFFRRACELGVEGMISKRADRPYRSGRTRDWVKVKCLERDAFVVGGFTEPGGAARVGVGALLLGSLREGVLRYVGRVGTGFDERTLRSLRRRLEPLEAAVPPFADVPSGRAARGVRWTRPELLVEVAYTGLTREGRLRHASFRRVCDDGAAATAPGRSPAPSPPHRSGGLLESGAVRLTSPDRCLYPESGVTKLDLARYYEAVSERMLREVAGRPLTLRRCPEGWRGDCFWQRHAGEADPEAIRRLRVRERGRARTYLCIDDTAGLLSLVQLGVLELHPWGARRDRLDRPDRLVFDLDPDADLPWARVVEGALLVRERLRQLGLESFVRTTGGKGLHVVAPIVRRSGWAEAGAFARAVAEALAHDAPDRFTARLAKARRSGRIFVDHLRNRRAATAVAAYSTRALAGAPVAMPLGWEELAGTPGARAFDVGTARERLSGPDPWAAMNRVRQSITARMKKDLGLA